MSLKLYKVNRKINIDDLESILEYKFIFNKIVNEIDDPMVLSMYILSERIAKERSHINRLCIVEQIKEEINCICKKYKLKNLNDLKFECLSECKSSDENWNFKYGLWLMQKYDTDFWYLPEFTKYMKYENLNELGDRIVRALVKCVNEPFVREEYYSVYDTIRRIKTNLNKGEYLILSFVENEYLPERLSKYIDKNKKYDLCY